MAIEDRFRAKKYIKEANRMQLNSIYFFNFYMDDPWSSDRNLSADLLVDYNYNFQL